MTNRQPGMVAVLLCLAILPGLAEIRAGLVFEATHLDITASVEATQTVAVFPFHVAGDQAITIKAIKSSCECTEGRAEQTAYHPGEQGEIRAVFKHGERTGEQFKTITVRTDELGVGPQRLSFKVVIPRVVEVVPVALFWQAGTKAESKEIRISFPNGKFLPVEVKFVGQQKFVSTAMRCLEQGKRYVLTVTPRSLSDPWKEELPIEMNFGEELGIRKQVCYAYVK